MNVDSYVQSLADDLGRMAAVGDDATVRAAELLTVALESMLARRLQEALAEAALELSTQIDGRVDVRLAGDDLSLVHVDDEPAATSDGSDEALDARITLRLPESLKSRVETAASGRRVSVNTWLVQAVERTLDSRSARSHSHRMTGYGRS